VQHGGGDHLVGVAAPAEQMRHLQRVQDERRVVGRAVLAGMARGRELQSGVRDRESVDEARELHRPYTLTPWRIAGSLTPL
jgi:hypothetical protein